MPKKTRQEKILAQLHRLQQQTSPVINSQPTENIKVVKSDSVLESLTKVSQQSKVSPKVASEDYSYVVKDLRKTLIFAASAVLFEIILSVVRNLWH